MKTIDDFFGTDELAVRTFLLRKGKKINTFAGLYQNWNDYFIESSELNATFRNTISFENNSVNGAIVIRHYGESIMGLEYWDYVDQLWAYFVNLLEEIVIRKKDFACFHFPDQPVLVELSKQPRNVYVLSVDGKKCSFIGDRFITEMVLSAEKFFHALLTVSNLSVYHECISTIGKIKKELDIQTL